LSLAEPRRWGVQRLRDVAELRVSNVDKHAKEGEIPVRLCNYVDVYKNDRITEGIAFMRATATPVEVERFRIRRGDVLMTKDSETWTDIGVPALVEYEADDLVSGYHLALLRPRYGYLVGGFLLRALQSPDVAHQLHVAATGVTRYGLSHAAIKSVVLPVPSLADQADITRFLDHADRRIRRSIRAKQKLIALMNEQKQAVIHRAVTRGLDPNARLKSSGVEWLGDVPEHWEVLPLRRRWSVTDCKHLTVPFVDEGIPLASIREVQTFELSLAKAKRTGTEWYEVLIGGGRQPCRGDLIYCRNVSVGAAALVDTDEQFAMGQDVCLIRSREQNQRYLNYFLRSAGMKRQLASLLIGSTFNRINVADVKNLTIVVPPRGDQDAIVGHLDRELRETDAAIEVGRQEIKLLREYRTRLIADTVTGKFDVREAASQLPDEAHEPEPLDQFDLEPIDEVDAQDIEEIEVEA
jgi:type I restriction enzyme, S subunit